MTADRVGDPYIPALYSLYSPEARDMAAFSPRDPEDFQLSVQAFIGDRQDPEKRADSFDFVLISLKALARLVREKGFAFGEPYFVLERYDYGLLETEIKRICARISGEDWRQVGLRLSIYFHWEYL